MPAREIRFSVLHVSDLHERASLPSMSQDRQTRIRLGRARRYRVLADRFDAILADVLRDGPVDALVFTGDVADWGLPEEYAEATRRFQRWLQVLRLSPQKLFVVPGNHDVCRTIAPDAWREVRAVALESPMAVSDWFGGTTPPRGVPANLRDDVLHRQDAFWAWVRALRGDDALTPGLGPHPYLGYRHTLALPDAGFPIHVFGLDSSWLAGADDDTGKLLLLDSQVDLLTTSSQTGEPLPGFRLALIHHPLGALFDERRAQEQLCATADLLLHGHQHDPIAGDLVTPDGRLCRLAAGAVYVGDQGDRWLNAFQRVDAFLTEEGRPLRYEVTFYAWADRGYWHRSSAIYRAAPDGRLILTPPPNALTPDRTAPSKRHAGYRTGAMPATARRTIGAMPMVQTSEGQLSGPSTTAGPAPTGAAPSPEARISSHPPVVAMASAPSDRPASGARAKRLRNTALVLGGLALLGLILVVARMSTGHVTPAAQETRSAAASPIVAREPTEPSAAEAQETRSVGALPDAARTPTEHSAAEAQETRSAGALPDVPPIKVAEWKKCAKRDLTAHATDDGCYAQHGQRPSPDAVVNCVTWGEANDCCVKLHKHLPTPAELKNLLTRHQLPAQADWREWTSEVHDSPGSGKHVLVTAADQKSYYGKDSTSTRRLGFRCVP